VVAEGSPSEVVTPQMLREVFGVEAEILPDPRTGAPLVMPVGLRGTTPLVHHNPVLSSGHLTQIPSPGSLIAQA
jgi:hypothetical protein